MRLLTRNPTVFSFLDITQPAAASAPTALQAVVTAPFPLDQTTRVTIRSLSGSLITPAAAGVISLESAFLRAGFNGTATALFASLGFASLTALADNNVVALGADWVIPGAAVGLALGISPAGFSTLEMTATVNNTSAGIVNVSVTGMRLLVLVETYDEPVWE